MQGYISKILAGVAMSIVFLAATAPGAKAEGAYPIAGVHPDQRPAGAPVIAFMSKDAAWFKAALAGVSRPYPKSLYFLDNQGRWFNPFQHPGMNPPYDIRGHHKQ
jgi:hypothetical protein